MPRLSACSKAGCKASVSVAPSAWMTFSPLAPRTIKVHCTLPVETTLNLVYTGSECLRRVVYPSVPQPFFLPHLGLFSLGLLSTDIPTFRAEAPHHRPPALLPPPHGP